MLSGWVTQASGLALVAVALMVMGILATYTPHDPSFNTVTGGDGPVGNMLGMTGAAIADLFLQLFGLGAWLIPLSLASWGSRLLATARKLERLWLRLMLVLCGLLLVSIGLANVPPTFVLALPSALHGAAGALGGSVGRLMLDGLLESIGLLGGDRLRWFVPLISGGFGGLCVFFGLGFSPGEWRAMGSFLWRLRTVARGAIAGVSEKVHRSEERHRPEPHKEKSPSVPFERVEPTFAAKAEIKTDTPEAPVESAPPGTPPEEPAVTVESEAPESVPPVRQEAEESSFELPRLDFLAAPPQRPATAENEYVLTQNARLLETVLADFGVNGSIIKVRAGPVVTLYELEPAPGIKSSRVIGLADDIAHAMNVPMARIAIMPGRSVIGIELPNGKRESVYLRELLASEAFERAPARLTLALGKDTGGQPMMIDLARMPHLLLAGVPDSGKMVTINTMILSLLYRLRPTECRMILIDSKMLELSIYEGIPHLLTPVITESGKAVLALKWAVHEMENRYRAMSQLSARNINGFNQYLADTQSRGETLSRTVQTGFDAQTGDPIYEKQELDLKPLPFIVIVIAEFADLLSTAGRKAEASIQRLAQMARSAGIHLIMATDHPSPEVMTETIKTSFPSRICFRLPSKIDSRLVLNEQGAEQLLEHNDMLYLAAGGQITRMHNPGVSGKEVEAVAEHLRHQSNPDYVKEVTETETIGLVVEEGSLEAFYEQAVDLVIKEGKVSISFIQHSLQIGYSHAARLIERMEQEGVISRANHVGQREVLMPHHDRS